MIRFDIKKLHVRYVMLKSCTTALGGSARIVDDLATAADPNGKEIYRKMDVPMALIRSFVQEHKTSQYLKPVPVAVTTYDDHVVALERHPLGSAGVIERASELFDGYTNRWVSQSEKNIGDVFKKMLEDHTGDWYIDGKYIWNFPKPMDQCVAEGSFLSSDGRFRDVRVDAIKLADIGSTTKLCVASRCCLAFVASRTVDKAYAVSPPVWKTLEVADRQLSGVKQQDDDNDRVGPVEEQKKYRFDEIDEWLAVNLNFVLKAGKELGQIFGPEIMEPLNLPKLMIQLQTVNLPSVANSVKSTFDTGVKFTHACAWLIGLVTRTDTFESYVALRSLLKYLTSKGIFRKHLFRPEHVFKDGFSLDTIPVYDKETILEERKNAKKFKEGFEVVGGSVDLDEWVRQQRATGGSTRVLGTDIGNAMTGMVDDEMGVDF